MGVSIARTRFAAPTTSGTQDITISGFGTVKAALFAWTYAIADNTVTDGSVKMHGATDGSEQGVRGFRSQHAQTSSVTFSYISTIRTIVLFDDAGTELGYATFDSFITDGIRLSWTITTARAVLIEAEFFGGTDLSVDVHNATLTNTLDVATDITAPGFEPDDVITFASGSSGLGIGFTHNDRAGGLTQMSGLHRSRNARPTMEVTSVMRDNYGGCIPAGAFSLDANSWLEFSAFDSSGFTVTPRTAAPGSTGPMFVSLRYGSSPVVSSKVYIFTTPTSTGNSTDTGPGFEPQAVHYAGTIMEAVATYYQDGLAGSSSWSVITAGSQGCISASDEDAAADSNTQSLIDDIAVVLPLDTGAAGLSATLTSMQSTGPQLNWSDVETAGKKFVAWAVQVFSTPPDGMSRPVKPNTRPAPIRHLSI